jgi:hypothetical protein
MSAPLRPRLPALGVLLTAAERALRRFPLVWLSAVVAATAGILLINSGESEERYARVMVAATLGLPLLFALAVTAERRFAAQDPRRWAVQGAGIVVLVAIWWVWPHWPEPVRFARYVQLSAAFHLLAAFLPYAGFNEPNGFWQYNRALFLRFLVAGIFAAVLYGGLALALGALDKLFGVDIEGEAYGRLWMMIAFVFTSWFFLGGIPDDFPGLDARGEVPPVLRIFTQYVLVPIVTIYLVMLTLYLGKVLIGRQWPSGWIGYLVSSVATVGIFAWLLVWPLEDRPEYRWVRTYTRGFYVALLPAIVVLWFAIGKRVAQYGITEPRYFLIVLSLWLAGIAVYYTLGRSRDIRVIPATLCVVALVTAVGPWGAYQFSIGSQRRRLDAMLVRFDLHTATNRAAAATRDVPFTDRREISATLRYLVSRHDRRGIAARFGGSATVESSDVEQRVRAIMNSLGVAYVSRYAADESRTTYFLHSEASKAPIPISGYQYAIPLDAFRMSDTLRVDDATALRYLKPRNVLIVERSGQTVLEIPFVPIIERTVAYRRGHNGYELPANLMRTEVGKASGPAALLYLRTLDVTQSDSGWRVTSIGGQLFLRPR